MGVVVVEWEKYYISHIRWYFSSSWTLVTEMWFDKFVDVCGSATPDGIEPGNSRNKSNTFLPHCSSFNWSPDLKSLLFFKPSLIFVPFFLWHLVAGNYFSLPTSNYELAYMRQSQFNTLLWAACWNTFVVPTPDTDWPLAEDTFPWWRARPPLRKGLLLSLGHLAVDACHEDTQCLQCATEACYHFASYNMSLPSETGSHWYCLSFWNTYNTAESTWFSLKCC